MSEKEVKRYELIIEENQPTCGGNTPTKNTIMEIETDDPVAYVKRAEGKDTVETETDADGSLVVSVQRDDYRYWVKYYFTED